MNLQLARLIPAVLALCVLNAGAVTRYVDLNSPSPTPPYASWPTAATNIQDAIDAAAYGDLVLVTNGVYATGGRVVYGAMTNRVAVTKPVTLLSVNGPSVTVIQGYQVTGTTNGNSAIRCVYLTNAATLSGFTLSNGATLNLGHWSLEQSGGGVWCESVSSVVSNCNLVGSHAYNGGGSYSGTLNNCIFTQNSASGRGGGGGAARAVLNNCTISSNSSSWYGGGVSHSTLNNCTIVGNSAAQYDGGGASYSTLNNCIVFFNMSPVSPNHTASTLNYCCSAPMPSAGVGNFTNAPVFLNQANGNFRLQATSPCINSGRNASAPADPDLDGNPRISGGTVDIGAYEFQSPSSVLSYAWAQQYGLPTDGSADFTDLDDDGMNNYGEWRSDTVPTNTLSVLRMVAATNSPTGTKVTWQSVATRNYWVERATNSGGASPFSTIASNLPGVAGTKTYTDASATNAGPYFYRVGVQ